MARSRTLAAVASVLLAATVAHAAMHVPTNDGWYSGRATFFGASDELVHTFERIRGPGSYGDLVWGSCGYYNKPQGVKSIRVQDLPFDQTFAAAAADANPDFPGSCGRCYEVRCKTGVVPKDYHDDKGSMTPFKISEHFYMPKFDTSLKDTKGRTWLGNPWEKDGLQGAVCWGNETTWIRIVDSCPPNPQSPWCRADSSVFHFDMSYWAFEKLAHPLYGVMPIEFRPIDCDTKAPLEQFVPGKISGKSIYDQGIKPGWTMYTWLNGYQQLAVAGASKKAVPACASLLSGGGIRFACRGCEKDGYQPFYNSTHISFRVKSDSSVFKFPASPAGSIPPLKAYLIRGKDGQENYCGESFLNKTAPTAKLDGGWYQFDIPVADFMCNSPTGKEITGFGLSHANATVYANNGAGAPKDDYVGVCVDKIEVGMGPVPEPAEVPVAATKPGAAAAPAAPVAPRRPAGPRWATNDDLETTAPKPAAVATTTPRRNATTATATAGRR